MQPARIALRPVPRNLTTMETLYLLVPLSLVLVVAIGAALWWALQAGQYDDLERPAQAILLDNDRP